MHKHATDYTNPLLADFERNRAVFESIKIPNPLADLQRNRAALESIKTPNFIADFERNRAALESIKTPNPVTDFQRNLVVREELRMPNIFADLERNRAALEGLKTPNPVTDFQRNLVVREELRMPNIFADLERNRAALEGLKTPNFLADFQQRNAATFENVKEHRDNYVETDYNHDLDYRGKEEPNHPIEDKNKGITSAAPSQHQITEAPTSLGEEVSASQDLPLQRQTEIPGQLESPSEQDKLASPQRKVGRVKSFLTTFGIVLGAGGGSAEIWSQWGDEIKKSFGILAELCSRWSDTIKNLLGIYE